MEHSICIPNMPPTFPSAKGQVSIAFPGQVLMTSWKDSIGCDRLGLPELQLSSSWLLSKMIPQRRITSDPPPICLGAWPLGLDTPSVIIIPSLLHPLYASILA